MEVQRHDDRLVRVARGALGREAHVLHVLERHLVGGAHDELVPDAQLAQDREPEELDAADVVVVVEVGGHLAVVVVRAGDLGVRRLGALARDDLPPPLEERLRRLVEGAAQGAHALLREPLEGFVLLVERCEREHARLRPAQG